MEKLGFNLMNSKVPFADMRLEEAHTVRITASKLDGQSGTQDCNSRIMDNKNLVYKKAI